MIFLVSLLNLPGGLDQHGSYENEERGLKWGEMFGGKNGKILIPYVPAPVALHSFSLALVLSLVSSFSYQFKTKHCRINLCF